MPAELRIRLLVVARDLEIRRRVAGAFGPDTRPGVDLEEVADAASARERLAEGGLDAVLVRLQPPDGLTAVRQVHAAAPDVPLVALLATGTVDAVQAALEAGAADSLAEDRLDPEVLRRTLRFAIERGRLQREVHRQAVIDGATGVFNARGFEQVAEHHIAVSDRAGEPVVLVFVRIEGRRSDRADAATLVRDTAAVLRDAVRDADVVGRLGADTFGVLLAGDATGNEGVVLSRIVEAVATRNARTGISGRLSLSLGSATHDAEHPAPLRDLIREADERMRAAGPAPPV
jgi:two-component system, cell cycle response regulator